MTPQQRGMLKKYDLEAKNGNEPAAVIALALRIKICRACPKCSGWASVGSEGDVRVCPTCHGDGIVDSDGVVIGRTTQVTGARKPEGTAR